MGRYTRLALLVAAFLVGACFTIRYQAKSLENVRRESYEYAMACTRPDKHKLTHPTLKFEDIRWRVFPDSFLVLPKNDSTYRKIYGFFDDKDSTIWISKTLAHSLWANAHEVTHALGFFDHPRDPFTRCGLAIDQHSVVMP
jgi:hypothetical protein